MAHQLLRRSALKPGDVLVTIAGTIGRIGFVGREIKEANCNQAVAFIRCDHSAFDYEWLCLLLQSPAYQAIFKEFVAGGAIPNISLQQIGSIKIPLISIAVQRQIAARLRAQLAEVDKARQATKTQLRDLNALAESIVLDSLRRSTTETRPLGEVLDEVKTGIGESWADFPVLGATRDGLAPAKEPPGKQPWKYKPVFPGTVFYNPMRILIGSIAYVDEDDTPGITSPDYVALQGKSGVVDSRWFYFWLRSRLGQQCINSLARGAVRERMLFNRLAEGHIDLPAFAVQRHASEALQVIKPMRQAIERTQKEIDFLPPKILAQAFKHSA